MKTRIITGVVAAIVAIVALVFLPAWAIRIVMALITVIATHEVLRAGGVKHKGMTALAMLFAVVCPFADMVNGFTLLWIALAVYAVGTALLLIACHKTLPLEHVAFTLFSSVTVILPLSTLSFLRAMDSHGLPYLFLTMVICWGSDTGAYFTGCFLGKHKLCPVISPKKTVEGFVGGIVTAVVMALVAAFCYGKFALADVEAVVYWQVALAALVAAPLSVVGDLFCSVIKRHYGIKDYGKLFPGHGGILDRFDSLVFVAPLLYLYVSYLPMIAQTA